MSLRSSMTTMSFVLLTLLPFCAMAQNSTQKICSNKDGKGAAATCGTGFAPKAGSTSCTTCANDGPECCVCGFDNWGAGIPFAKGKTVAIADDLNNGNLNLTFTLATQPCVDRPNQLSLSFRGTGAPVCQAINPADFATCAATMSSGGKSACVADAKCRYRIACTKDNLDLKELFLVEENHKQDVAQTEYSIAIRTNSLSTVGSSAGIYTGAQTDNTVAKLEVCLRPSISVDGVEVLFREVVATVTMDMTGGVSLSIKSDSYDAGGVEDVDADVDFNTDAFACQSTDNNGVVTYEKVPPAPLTPNSVLTLCVTGKRATVRCTDIQDLVFKQGTATTENRIADYAATGILTQKTTGVNIRADGASVTGCMVAARLGGVYFQGLNPENVVITGTALMDFVPARGRRLLSDDTSVTQSTTVAVTVGPGQAQNEQTSDFGAEFSIARNPNGNTRVGNNDFVSAANMMSSQCAAIGLATTTTALLAI